MPEENTPDEQEDDYVTSDTRTRWEGLATVVTFLIFVAFLSLLIGGAFGLFTLGSIGQAWFVLFSTVLLMAATWLYGEDTLNAVQRARGK
jgi:hypothetical protein